MLERTRAYLSSDSSLLIQTEGMSTFQMFDPGLMVPCPIYFLYFFLYKDGGFRLCSEVTTEKQELHSEAALPSKIYSSISG